MEEKKSSEKGILETIREANEKERHERLHMQSEKMLREAKKKDKANEEYENFKDNIKEYSTYDAAIMDLKAGRVDVVVIDQVLGEYTNNNLNGAMKECEYSLGDDYYVIGCAKGNTALVDALNTAIKELIDDGTAAEISEKWFGKDIVVFEELD